MSHPSTMAVRTATLPKLSTRLPTHGELNDLNEKYQCNSRRNTVPVMDLVRYHRPDNPEVLRQLIEKHHNSACSRCRCNSAGTVEQFASRLYLAQFKEKLTRRYSWDECYRFHYTLFCIAPLRGRSMEHASRNMIAAALKNDSTTATCHVREATQTEDFECAVDLVIARSADPTAPALLGIQVKPQSVLHRTTIMEQNRQKHAAFAAPVIFHIYDRRGTFTPGASSIVQKVKNALITVAARR